MSFSYTMWADNILQWYIYIYDLQRFVILLDHVIIQVVLQCYHHGSLWRFSSFPSETKWVEPLNSCYQCCSVLTWIITPTHHVLSRHLAIRVIVVHIPKIQISNIFQYEKRPNTLVEFYFFIWVFVLFTFKIIYNTAV